MIRFRTVLLFVLSVLPMSLFCQQAGSPWPKLRQNNSNSAAAAGGGSNGILRWRFSTSGPVEGSATVGSDGTVYVGSTDFNLYAISKTGALLWSFQTGGPIYSAPAIKADGSIVVGSSDGSVYAFSPLGDLKWVFTTGGPVNSSPAFGPNGEIYVGSEDWNLYALSAAGLQNWAFQTGGFLDSSPAVGQDGTVYVASADTNVYAVSAAGQQKWVCQTGGVVWASPTIGPDGTIYAGCTDNNLYAISPSGAVSWTFPTQSYIDCSQALGPDGTIYVGSTDDNLYAVNPDGTQKWAFTAGNAIESAPTIGLDGVVYFGSDDFNVYAVNPDGSLRWTYATGGSVFPEPAIGFDGALYVGSDDGNVYAIGTEVNTVAVSSVSLSPASVEGGLGSIGTVKLASAAPGGGDVVMLSSSSASAILPAFVVVPGGASSATFEISTQSVPSTTQATITATSGSVSVTATISILPSPLAGVSLSPTSVVGGNPSSLTVSLSAPAPSGGTAVMLTSSNSAVTLPATAVVPEGGSSIVVQVATAPVAANTSAVLTAAYGIYTATATLAVLSPVPTALAFSPSTVGSGLQTTGTVTLSGNAPVGGLIVSLASDSAVAPTPTSVVVPAGLNSGSFTITATSVTTATKATIEAMLGSTSVTANITVVPQQVASVTVSPSVLIGGATSVGTIALNTPAPPGGTVVSLASGNSVVSVPQTVSFSAGSSQATFPIKTKQVTQQNSVTITASLNGSAGSAQLQVVPASIVGLSLSPSTVSGGSQHCTGLVTVSGAAPQGGITIPLASSGSSAKVPASVTVMAGASTGLFTITTSAVKAATTATITATYALASKSAILTIVPATLVSVSIQPDIVGGNTVTGTVTLSGSAYSGGDVVSLSSSSSSLVVPATLRIAAGASSGTFSVIAKPVSTNTQATVVAKLGSVSVSTAVTVHPPSLIGVSVAPAQVVGGVGTVTGAVTLDGIAPPTGILVSLASSNAGAAAIPASIKVNGGANKATFVVKTTAVATSQSATLTAMLNGTTESTMLTVTPPTLVSVALSPKSVKGSSSTAVTGTVTLSAGAPAGGLTVGLTSSLASAAGVPAVVVISAGKTSATFKVTHSTVKTQTTVTITAVFLGSAKTATLTVTP